MRCVLAILLTLTWSTVAVIGNDPGGSLHNCPFQQEGEQALSFTIEACLPGDAFDSTTSKKFYLHIASEYNAPTNGKLFLSFRDQSSALEMPIKDVTSEACTRAMQVFSITGKINCVRELFREDPVVARYAITLTLFPGGQSKEKGVYPSASEFSCTFSDVIESSTAIKCQFEGAQQRDPQNMHSNSGGSCDDQSRVCISEDGLHEESRASPHGMLSTGALLRLVAKRSLSEEFYLIEANVGKVPMLTVKGDGDTTLHRGSLYLQYGDVTLLGGGRINISSGGEVVVEKGRIHGIDSRFYLKHSGDSEGSTQDALIQVDFSRAEDRYSDPLDYLHFRRQKASVLQVRSNGSMVLHEGGLAILRGGATIAEGGLRVFSDGIQVREGDLNIESGALQVDHGPLRVDNGTGFFRKTFDSLSAVLRVEYDGVKCTSCETLAVLSLASNTDVPFLKASKIGLENEPNATLFEIKGSGETHIHAGGLKIGAGGIHIAAGGQVISAGGLRVEAGGIQIDGGRLTLRDGFKVDRGGLYVRNDADNAPTLHISSDNKRFSGSLLDIDISAQIGNASGMFPFDIMHAFRKSPDADRPRESIFKVQSDGGITTSGDFTSRGTIISHGAILATKMTFSTVTVMAGDFISIPSSHSYVRIQNDGTSSSNQADIDTTGAISGQLLIVQNDDDEAVHGAFQIIPSCSAIYIYDGFSWQTLPGIQKFGSELNGVRKFEALNDLDIGNVKFSAGRLQAAGKQAGRVAFYGDGGELEEDPSFQYDTTRLTLRVESLEVKTLEGEIDLSQSELHAVEIVGGHISHVNLTSINTIEVEGELVVDSSAYFGDGITVDGQVMGSGAYVDASDLRFKTNITYLTGGGSLHIISQLRAAEYNFKNATKWNKTHRKREIGFIAQEVEKVLPQVVTEDAQGFKYVAYARIIPVLTEGIKGLEAKVQHYELQMDKLRQQVERLERLLIERAIQ
uniref:Uncharacterized protein AlNc14C73G4982 n=1 Tax=Albugo laibachii Nc14 TaxID=890382 RepID=F0WEC6_9STRA|nr:conserved hypothetical protein [Albugo laibachii Nc14]|eukprot:CCA19557.1 conserved hypothetical protein [Albugo laibachii Nc14]